MPPVYRFLDVSHVRTQTRSLAGLQAGIDLTNTESLFGPQWDRDARDLGRRIRTDGVRVLVRGPGSDLPLMALDPYVVDQVKACHERAFAASIHYGARAYVARLGVLHGISRSERLARLEAAGRMVRHLAQAARSRGLPFAVEVYPDADKDAVDLLLDALQASDGGLVYNPGMALALGVPDVMALIEHCGDRLIGLDLTDRCAEDLQACIPGEGLLGDLDGLGEFLLKRELSFFLLDLPVNVPSADAVVSLNSIASRAKPSVAV